MDKGQKGFSLLEVMVAMAIIAIAMTAVLGSQSQSISLASEAKFNTTASHLGQAKMAEIEGIDPEDLTSDSGDFGEDFPRYTWQSSVEDVPVDKAENVSDHLKQINVIIAWGEGDLYQYQLKMYRFLPQQPID